MKKPLTLPYHLKPSMDSLKKSKGGESIKKEKLFKHFTPVCFIYMRQAADAGRLQFIAN